VNGREAPSASLRSPLDDAPWPDKLTARVVAPGPRPRIHGYDVEDDLARRYSFTETVFLALTGDLPTREVARAFDVVLQFLAPAPINEAPTHAAALARTCAGTTSSIQGTAAVALAEQARAVVAEHAAWIDALSQPIMHMPPEHRASSDAERESVERFRQAFGSAIEVPALSHDPSRLAALIAALRACGLKTAEQIECVMVLAKLPACLAEALATPAGSYRDYPVLLPPIAYEEDTG
jgi:hypothetical protein